MHQALKTEPLDAAPQTKTGKSGLQTVFVAVLFLFLCLPLAESCLHFLPAAKLNGIAPAGGRPKVSFEGLRNEKFQKAFEQWFMRANGFWPWFVKGSNQLYYSLFHQVSGSMNPSVLAAKDGYFFQPQYLKPLNRSRPVNVKKLAAVPAKLGKLQSALAARNIPLVTLISPNLAALYPELIPDQYIDSTRLSRRNSYEVIRPLLDKHGINFIDTFSYFSNLKRSSPIRFFEPTGSHWNHVASCMATDMIIGKIGELSGKKAARFTCQPYSFSYPPRSADRDLIDIANLLFPSSYYKSAPYSETKRLGDGSEIKPKILMIGTSFLFAIQQHLEEQKVTSEAQLFFYYKQYRKRSDLQLHTLNKRSIDWQKDILSYDAIVLEINQSNIGAIGYGFIEDALKHLAPVKK